MILPKVTCKKVVCRQGKAGDNLLVRQAGLSSEIKDESENIKWTELKSETHLKIFH